MMSGSILALGAIALWATLAPLRVLLQDVPPFLLSGLGLFGWVSGLLSVLCHALLEMPVRLRSAEWMLILAMGLVPLGAAFYLWDAAVLGSRAGK